MIPNEFGSLTFRTIPLQSLARRRKPKSFGMTVFYH